MSMFEMLEQRLVGEVARIEASLVREVNALRAEIAELRGDALAVEVPAAPVVESSIESPAAPVVESSIESPADETSNQTGN